MTSTQVLLLELMSNRPGVIVPPSVLLGDISIYRITLTPASLVMWNEHTTYQLDCLTAIGAGADRLFNFRVFSDTLRNVLYDLVRPLAPSILSEKLITVATESKFLPTYTFMVKLVPQALEQERDQKS
jgi:hypothetical protein